MLVVGPGGYATIGEAVAVAQDGDTVLVRPGTYPESVTITRAVRLVGEGDREAIIIESEAAPSLVLEASAARVSNLTVRGGALYGEDVGVAARIIGGSPDLDGLVVDCLIVVGASASPTIHGCRSCGISFRDGATGTASDNEIKAGLHVEGEGTAPLIRANRISDDPLFLGSILIAGGATGTIEDNDIDIIDEESGQALGAGIVVEGEGTAPLIRANRIHDSRSHGPTRDGRVDVLHIRDGATGTIEGNDISAISGGLVLGALILVEGRGTAPLIRGNRVHAGRSDGIVIRDGATSTIDDNEVFGSRGNGVEVSGCATSTLIRANRVHDGDGAGIAACDGAMGRIEDNDVFGNVDSGVKISGIGTAPLVRANRIHGGKWEGITVADGATSTIENNDISGNAVSGIGIYEPGTSPVIRANRVFDGTVGIGVYNGAAGAIEGNDIAGNACEGIEVAGKGTAPFIRANRIRGSSDGITVRAGGGGQVIDNTILDSLGAPIRIETGSSPIVAGNIFE
jgi:parallel beta-helix repeat protein